jgi:hypothetical protein
MNKFEPSNNLEKEIFDYADGLRIWWETLNRETRKKLGDNAKTREYLDFEKNYKKEHPFLIEVPMGIKIDFGNNDYDSILRRLRSGYFIKTKLVVLHTEYDNEYYIIKDHLEDIPKAATEIVKFYKDFIPFVQEMKEPKKPDLTNSEVLEKLPLAQKEIIKSMEEKSLNGYKYELKEYNKNKLISDLYKKHLSGDAVASVRIIREFLTNRQESKNWVEVVVPNQF